MFTDGKVYHHFYYEGNGELTKHCDDPLWFILAVTDYLKETGDLKILDEIVPFVDDNEGTILDHLYAVVKFVKGNLAKHNLPVFGRGDWNDTLDYIGVEMEVKVLWVLWFCCNATLNKRLRIYKLPDEKIIELRNKIS